MAHGTCILYNFICSLQFAIAIMTNNKNIEHTNLMAHSQCYSIVRTPRRTRNAKPTRKHDHDHDRTQHGNMHMGTPGLLLCFCFCDWKAPSNVYFQGAMWVPTTNKKEGSFSINVPCVVGLCMLHVTPMPFARVTLAPLFPTVGI